MGNSQFDPYYTWLGIPPSEQPPSHYRLLGIQVYEANTRVIDNAADRQMMHLRSFQNGPQSDLSQRLLNEVAAARICLHDPLRKAAYDGALRRLENPNPPPVTSSISVPHSGPNAPPLTHVSSKQSRPSPARNAALEIAKIVVGGIVGIIVAAFILQFAVGVNLMDWSAKAQNDRENGPKSVSKESLQKPAAKSDSPASSTTPSSLPPIVPEQPPVIVAPPPAVPPVAVIKDESTSETLRKSDLAPETAGALTSGGEEGTQFKLVYCPPGKFLMGSPVTDMEALDREKPQVLVTLTRGFWLGQTVVTQGEWKRVMGTEPWIGIQYVKEGDRYPATMVSWDDAVAYCEKLTQRERKSGRLPKDESYRLPSETEWEYACRADTKFAYSFGDKPDHLEDYGWFNKNSHDAGEVYAHQVAQKKANPWGLFDMHGNVLEWCTDFYADKLPGETDPVVTVGGNQRVLRGGSWSFIAFACRSANRDSASPDSRSNGTGFRVARSRFGTEPSVPDEGVTVGTPEPPKITRIAVPDAATLVAARTKLKETFGDIAKSKNPQDRQKLSADMRGAADSEKDSVIRYALLDAARRLAMAAEDVQAALLVTDELVKQYEIDPLDAQLATLKLAAGTTMPAPTWETTTAAAINLSRKSLKSAREDIADGASLLAIDFAAKGKNLDQRRQAKQIRADVLDFRKLSATAKEAERILMTTPEDSAANLTLGKWYCFVLADWSKGIAYLEKSGNPLFVTAAQKEKDPKNSLAIADAWYDALAELKEYEKAAAQMRSFDFYSKAATESSGLDALRASRRIQELRALAIVTNSLGMKFSLIPVGEFLMGSPESESGRRSDEFQHRVKITKPFYLGVYEVTQGEYEKLMGSNPADFSQKGAFKSLVAKMDTSRFPVENITWKDAVKFCEKLTREEIITWMREAYGKTP